MASRPKTVFIDVNLRAPWYQLPQVSDMLHSANWVKLNSDELNLLYPSSKSRLPRAVDFLSEYGLSGLVVTHGAEGAELITDNGEHFTVKPEQDIDVVDTVGAGDAFASVIILGLNNDWPLDITLQRAQLFASLYWSVIAVLRSAMPASINTLLNNGISLSEPATSLCTNKSHTHC